MVIVKNALNFHVKYFIALDLSTLVVQAPSFLFGGEACLYMQSAHCLQQNAHKHAQRPGQNPTLHSSSYQGKKQCSLVAWVEGHK